MMVQMLVQLAR